ncbi:MAG: LPS-assembly protein LptD [Bacteroidetes bacterium]|nr:MAG: LPS-assembly protein LptD [Bacteroidota bacterium]MBL1144716.1 LPS-assembly protein LptD [Bacteroidota bacterium]NOG57510.1 LPS-assembly protein LptD [Bacteroidota bacterium]
MLITTVFSQELIAQEKFDSLHANFPIDTNQLIDSSKIIINTNSDSSLTKIDTTLSKDAITTKVKYQAKDSMRFDMAVEKVYLFGKAQVNYGNIQLTADYIEVDLSKNTVLANGLPDSTGEIKGLPVFKEGAQEYQAGKMTYNFKTKKGKISEVKTQEGDGYIKGNEVKKTAEDIMYIRNGYYTTCSLDDPHFSLATSKLKVIPNDKIITGPTVLKIEGVPTPLGLPFGFFPNKKGRASGIVIPTYGDSRSLGFFLRDGGFYWGINDYIDATITADIYSLGSWGTKINSRYKNKYHFDGNINYSYANIRNGYKEFPDFNESKEMFLRWTHNQDPKARPGSRFSANVNVGTRNNFTNNLNSFSQDYLTNTFQSSVSYTNSFPSKPFNLTVSARHDQNTQTGAFNVNLPEVAFNVSRQYPFKQFGKIGNEWWRSIYKNFGLSYSSSATNQLRTIDTLISFNNFDNLKQDFSNGFRHSIPLSTSFKLLKFFNLNPSLSTNQIVSFRTIRKEYDPSKNQVIRDTISEIKTGETYSFNTTMSTKIYGMFQFKRGKVQAIRHVVTPQITYNYQPEIKSGIKSYTNAQGKEIEYSIFEGGVYGSPNREKSERIGFNLLNNIEMKVRSDKDSTGTKKITLFDNLGFSSNYNTVADSLNWSPVSINGRTRIGNFITFQFNGIMDPYGLDTSGRKINTSWNEQSGKLARLTSGNVSLNFSLKGGNPKKNKEKRSKYATDDEMEYINSHPEQFIDFSIPWSLNVGYNIRYNKPAFEDDVTQTMNFSGDVSLTKNWKIGFNSGWDFERKDLTYTSVNINRDLHCWQMAINWVPYGPRQSYMITINVKSPVLQDLKLNRRRDFYDVIR